MPNGHEFNLSEFQELESFIQPLDDTLYNFADRIGARIVLNYHNMAGRDLLFTTRHTLNGQLDIAARFLDYPRRSRRTCIIAVCVYKDYAPSATASTGHSSEESRCRKMWRRELARWTELPGSFDAVNQVLEEGYALSQQVKEEDLQ